MKKSKNLNAKQGRYGYLFVAPLYQGSIENSAGYQALCFAVESTYLDEIPTGV